MVREEPNEEEITMGRPTRIIKVEEVICSRAESLEQVLSSKYVRDKILRVTGIDDSEETHILYLKVLPDNGGFDFVSGPDDIPEKATFNPVKLEKGLEDQLLELWDCKDERVHLLRQLAYRITRIAYPVILFEQSS